MTIKTLKECRARRNKLQRLEDSIERLNSAMVRITQVLSLAPGRGGLPDDALAEKLDILIGLTKRRAQQTIELEVIRAAVEEWLDTLPEQQANIIYWRYVKGLPWDEVAKKVHYSKDHCYKIHEVALKKCGAEGQQ